MNRRTESPQDHLQKSQYLTYLSILVGSIVEKKEAYQQLSIAYEGLFDFENALLYNKLFLICKDSIFSIGKVKELESIEKRYQVENKQLQIENLKRDNEIKMVTLEKMKTRQLMSFVIIIISAVFIFGLLVVRKKLKRKNLTIFEQNEEIFAQKDELENHQKNLEQIVDDRTRDLKIAKEKAEESDKLKSAFLANMSHEIRTPMNSIMGFADLLCEPDLDEKTKKMLTTHINSSTDTLLKLIDDIIDIAKIESGQLSINKCECSIKELFNKLAPIYFDKKTALEKEHIEVFINQPDNDEIFYTDPLRLHQVLINLTNNALKFTEKGTIEIGYNTSNKNGTDVITFYVKDTGIGISEEEKKIIFKRFSKIENKKQKLYRGAGLGLAICTNLIKLLGGELWVESEKDKGSAFYFSLPFSKLA